VTDWVGRLIDWGGYGGVFLLMLIETIFPPIPSEVILPIAGLRAAHGPMSLPGVIASATAGAMTGNLAWYLLARRIGLARFRRFVERYGRWLSLDWADVEKVQKAFDRFGSGIVFVGRILPTFRTFVSMPAGLVHMGMVKYLIWSTLGTAIWSGLLAAAGYGVGVRFGTIEEIVGPATTAAVALIVLFILWRQLTWNRRRR
jgi:membrane protein DedA with SNARE-associated domain